MRSKKSWSVTARFADFVNNDGSRPVVDDLHSFDWQNDHNCCCAFSMLVTRRELWLAPAATEGLYQSHCDDKALARELGATALSLQRLATRIDNFKITYQT